MRRLTNPMDRSALCSERDRIRGWLTIGGHLTTLNVPSDKREEGSTDKLRQLKALLDEGLITQEQFEAKRDQILNDL